MGQKMRSPRQPQKSEQEHLNGAQQQRHTYEQIHNKVLEIVFDKELNNHPFACNERAQAWVKETIEPDQLNREQRLQEQTTQKRATSVQTSDFKVRGVLSEKAGHTCMNGHARILKTRL